MGVMRKGSDEVSNPPFDGSPPCICCPMEVRSLLAATHNFLVVWKAQDQSRITRYIERLREANDSLQKYADAHFADVMHSHNAETAHRVAQRPDVAES